MTSELEYRLCDIFENPEMPVLGRRSDQTIPAKELTVGTGDRIESSDGRQEWRCVFGGDYTGARLVPVRRAWVEGLKGETV